MTLIQFVDYFYDYDGFCGSSLWSYLAKTWYYLFTTNNIATHFWEAIDVIRNFGESRENYPFGIISREIFDTELIKYNITVFLRLLGILIVYILLPVAILSVLVTSEFRKPAVTKAGF